MTTTTTNPLDRLGALAKSAPAKPKGKDKPTFNLPELDDTIAEYIARKAEAETAKTLMDQAKDQIAAAAAPLRLQASLDAGKNLSSITINNRLTFTVQCRYSTVPEEATEDLRAAFGDAFGRYFAEEFSIALSKAAAANPAVLTELLDKLGEAFVAEHFDVRRDLKVKPAFHEAYATDESVQAAAGPFVDSQTIKCAAPSLKVK